MCASKGDTTCWAVRPSLQKTPVGVLDVRENPAARPLSAGAAGVFSHVRTTNSSDGWNRGPVQQNQDCYQEVVAEISVPAVAGVRFSAVAEVHASADEVDDDTSLV